MFNMTCVCLLASTKKRDIARTARFFVVVDRILTAVMQDHAESWKAMMKSRMKHACLENASPLFS